MLAKILPSHLIGLISLSLHILNILFWVPLILMISIIKIIFQIKIITAGCNYLLNFFATNWISINSIIHKITKPIQWQVSIPKDLSTKSWYLVISNHQSWADILALQHVFNRKIPFLKFFLKQQLFWIPVIGLAWWALDFPFMKRYSKSYLKKNPHKKGQDFKTTKKACEKFKSIPISIMNFVEGTRFTQAKKQIQNSPYDNLLKPKAGGIGYILTLMGNEINQVLNVTISYPNNSAFSSWDFLCGKVTYIKIDAELLTIPDSVKGDYVNSSENRKQTQQWVNRLWIKKDKQLSANLDGSSSSQ